MTPEVGFVFLTIVLAGVMMASNRVRYDLVALLVVLALVLGDILTIGQALSGFGSTVVILVACLLVVGEMLERTGVARSVGNMILKRGGDNETRLLILLMVSSAILGSVMSSTAVVAIFIPIILRIAADTGIHQSRLLLPMSYAALISGMLTLIATTPNLVISDELVDHGFEALGFFSFLPIGAIILVVAIAYVLLWARRFLGTNVEPTEDAGVATASGLIDIWETFAVQNSVDLLSVNADHSLNDVRALNEAGYTLIARWRSANNNPQTPVVFRGGMELEAGDRILVRASRDNLDALAARREFTRRSAARENAETWLTALGLADVLVHPEATSIGKPASQAVAEIYDDIIVLALVRDGEIETDASETKLKAGDRLLVGGPWEHIDGLTNHSTEFVLLRTPSERREFPPAWSKFGISLAILTGMVVFSAMNIVSVTVAVILAAIAAVLFRTLSAEDAYRSINLPTLVLIAGMLPLADALEQTGGSDLIVGWLLDVVGQADPRAMMAALFLLTAILGLVLSNTASAVLVAPIAIVAAETLGISPYPMAIAVLMAASAAFSTPVSTPVVTLVVAPGGYEFADFLKIGVPLTLLVALITIFVTPIFFPF